MSKTAASPRVAELGIHFSVIAGSMERDCIVSKNALAYLGRGRTGDMGFMEIYSGFEDKIHAVARRLVAAGESASPLILGAAYFVEVPMPAMS